MLPKCYLNFPEVRTMPWGPSGYPRVPWRCPLPIRVEKYHLKNAWPHRGGGQHHSDQGPKGLLGAEDTGSTILPMFGTCPGFNIYLHPLECVRDYLWRKSVFGWCINVCFPDHRFWFHDNRRLYTSMIRKCLVMWHFITLNIITVTFLW